ncbi:MAG: 3TM-type holin [Rhodospirillaceae bacterium]
MLAALLAQIGLPLLVRTVGSALGMIDNPLAATAALALKQVSTAVVDGRIPPEAVAEANRHVEKLAELESADFVTSLREINQTIRTEVVSEDAYVRRMRPTFGYIMAMTWFAQMGGLAYVIVTNPAQAGTVVNAMASLGTIWSVGLGVLGIYVYKRSDDKRLGPGTAPTDAAGLLGGLVQKLVAPAASKAGRQGR